MDISFFIFSVWSAFLCGILLEANFKLVARVIGAALYWKYVRHELPQEDIDLHNELAAEYGAFIPTKKE